MKTKQMIFSMVAAAVVMAPSMLLGQMDPTNPNVGVGLSPVGPQAYPQSPQGMNQPVGAGASTPATGAQTPQTSSMRDSLGSPGQTGQQMMDKQFLRSAAQGGLAEMKIGQLATEKGSPAVKTLAQQMVDDHAAMNKDMAGIADEMGIMVPKKMTKESQAEYDKLNGLSGKDFDAEYVNYLAVTHFADLHAFHMEAAVASEPDLATEVVKAMGVMHNHLGQIAKVAQDESITLPPRPQRPPAPTTASK